MMNHWTKTSTDGYVECVRSQDHDDPDDDMDKEEDQWRTIDNDQDDPQEMCIMSPVPITY